jgi:hypothetical protein
VGHGRGRRCYTAYNQWCAAAAYECATEQYAGYQQTVCHVYSPYHVLVASGPGLEGIADPVDLQFPLWAFNANDIEARRYVPGVMALHVNPGAMN